MFCIYCGRKLLKDYCTMCEIDVKKFRTFSAKTTWKDTADFFCFHCGGNVVLIRENRPREVAGLCSKCCKPFRVNNQNIGAVIYI